MSLPIIEWPDANDVWNFNGKPICIPCNTTLTPYRIRRMYVHMPNGSSHELRKSDVAYNGGVDTAGVFYAVDGSRIRYDADTATLYLPDGTRYILGGSTAQFIDRNGNTQNFGYNPSTAQWEWVDTVGRRIGQPPLGSSGRADIEYRIPGVNGTTAVYTFRWRYLRDPNTNESVITPSNPDQQLRNASDRYLSNPNSPPTNPAGDKKRAYEIVHQVAIDAVNVYRARVQGAPARRPFTTEGQVLDAAGNAVSPTGEIKYKVDYTTHYEYWTMDASSRFKLKSVEVVKKPLRNYYYCFCYQLRPLAPPRVMTGRE